MRLLRLQEVEIAGTDRVFRHPRFRVLLLWLAGSAVALALLIRAYAGHFFFGYILGGGLLLFLFLFRRIVTARFHPSNWLVRMTPTGLYVQYRSYLNYDLRADVPSVLWLSLDEIASARLIKERLETPDPQRRNGSQTTYLRHVELELIGGTADIAEALGAERDVRARTVFVDYPVTVPEPGFIRIHWNVVPRARKFLAALRPATVIADTVSLNSDFTRLKFLSRENQEKKLRDLAARGEVSTAAYAARSIYGITSAQAIQMVKSLNNDRGGQQGSGSA
jgi:hypothetical protein